MTANATERDLWTRSRDGRCELVDGRITDIPLAGARHGAINVRIASLLLAHVRQHQLGFVLAANTGFRMPNGNVRDPDVAFVAHGGPEALSNDFCPSAPDLAVEVLAPDDRARQVLDKVGEYLEAGTRLVWVVDPEARSVAVFRSLSEVETFRENDEVSGFDVLPGLRCRPADFL